MNPPIKRLSAPLLITLIIVGSFFVLESLGYGKAYVRPSTHTVVQQLTGEPDMASATEVKQFFKKIASEAKAHQAAVTVVSVFGPASGKEIALASDQVSSRPQKFTKLLGRYTRAKSLPYEYAEAK